MTGGRHVGVRQDEQELVAAHAHQQVGLADLRLQGGGHLLQHPVADEMAHGVVDRLEMIEVQRRQGERPAVTAGLLDQGGDALLEHEPVGQAGEGVAPRLGKDVLVLQGPFERFGEDEQALVDELQILLRQGPTAAQQGEQAVAVRCVEHPAVHVETVRPGWRRDAVHRGEHLPRQLDGLAPLGPVVRAEHVHALPLRVVVADQFVVHPLHQPDGEGLDHGRQVEYAGQPLVEQVDPPQPLGLLPVAAQFEQQVFHGRGQGGVGREIHCLRLHGKYLEAVVSIRGQGAGRGGPGQGLLTGSEKCASCTFFFFC